jgi:hypothetical protein
VPDFVATKRLHIWEMLASEITALFGDQVDDQDDERYDQQKVNQADGGMEAETQQPENQNDAKDCPKKLRAASGCRPHGVRLAMLEEDTAAHLEDAVAAAAAGDLAKVRAVHRGRWTAEVR